MSSSRAAPEHEAGFLARRFPTFARWLGSLGWPILFLQLRADFRKNRFFLSQLICLAVLGVVLIARISILVDERTKTAPQIGQELFDWFFIIQYLVILLIFPAFSATAFSEERSGLTMDLLLASTLRPGEIVWGKFLASSVYCLIFVVASIPLLSISFLFGGVQLREVLVAYAILVGFTLLVSMLGLFVSSCFTSSTRATLAVYMIVFALLGLSFLVYKDLEAALKQNLARTVVGALLQWQGSGLSLDPLRLAVIPAFAFAFLFVLTTNRIRPHAEDRSSALRMLAFAGILGFVGAAIASRLNWTGTGWVASTGAHSPWTRTLIVQAFSLLGLAALVFPTEEAAVSRRNRVRFAKWTGLRYPLRVFSPGAFWGYVYTLLLAVVTGGGILAAWLAFFRGGASADAVRLVVEGMPVLVLYISAFAALGFLLAACDFSPLNARLTVLFLFIITSLLPVIFFLSRDRGAAPAGWQSVLKGYYLSPFTLWESLGEVSGPEEEAHFLVFGAHVIDVAKWLFGALVVVLSSAAMAFSRRAGHPLARFQGRAGSPSGSRSTRGSPALTT